MKSQPRKTHPLGRRGRGAAVAAIVAVLLWACGGGTNVATVGTGGTGSFSVGAITGFGSVIVNGLRYEDTSASVSDDDGPRSKDDLQLGMVVKVEGSVSSSGSASGTATSILFDSELLGPVATDSIDSTNKTLRILGQKVLTHAGTVYAPGLANGFASIQAGDVLEVHGFLLPASNELQATLIERKTNPNKFKISGTLTNLSAASATFQVGTLTISYAGLRGSDVPSNLSDGAPVKVRLVPAQPSAGAAWPATRVRINKDALADKDEAEVEGVITALTNTATFSVGNVPVDARNASFRDGSAGLAVGARVEAKGSLVGGVLVASLVKAEDDGNEVELKGTISGLNTSAKTFVVRGQTVSYGAAVRYENGSQADLADGRSVEVKAQLPSAGTVLIATDIEF